MTVSLHHGDHLEVLRTMPEACVDAVVSDPPYGLAFLRNKWDYDVPSVEIWAECLRVLRPGGYLLAFAGTRTQHRMACRIEDAGFEIRDLIAWVYGSGFPKSLDVSEAVAMRIAGIDYVKTIPPDVYRVTEFLRLARMKAGWSNKQIDALFGTNGMAGHWTTSGSQPAVPSVRQWGELKAALGFGDDLDGIVAELGSNERPEDCGEGNGDSDDFLSSLLKDKDAPPAGGWGTALKPAMEPITMARKPLVGTFQRNIIDHGTGALNIDGCRIHENRWPPNFAHDGSCTRMLPIDGGESSERFFYCAKASRDDRGGGNNHPTVKPTDLMRWLVRLVTPPGGIVLDPFMGSGSTGKAALMEGMSFVGIERDEDSHAIATHRIRSATDAVAPLATPPRAEAQTHLLDIL